MCFFGGSVFSTSMDVSDSWDKEQHEKMVKGECLKSGQKRFWSIHNLIITQDFEINTRW